MSEEARKLLRYMEDSSMDNAESELLKDIHRMVETVRHDEEVALEYMKVYERERMIESRGETRGVVKGEVKIIRNMSKSLESSKISESTGLESKYVEKILAYIRQYPKESDAEISDRMLASGNENG